MNKLLLVIIVFTAVASCIEYDDLDQKKRGVTKGSSSNTIPSGAQEPDYTYSIYSQSSNSQNSQPVSSSSYQQVPNSFYPNQASSQYYAPSGTKAPQTYSSHSQVNPAPSQASHFTPINFVPTPGYQAKYQLVPSKQGIPVAIVQPPYSFQSPPVLQYPHAVVSPNQGSNVNHLNVSPFQQLLSNSYLGHPSSMYLFPQPHQLYSNLRYNSNPASVYYPSHNQAKYNVQFSSPLHSSYDTAKSQSVPKDENEVGSQSDYSTSSDLNSNYKNDYSSRTNYVKLT